MTNALPPGYSIAEDAHGFTVSAPHNPDGPQTSGMFDTEAECIEWAVGDAALTAQSKLMDEVWKTSRAYRKTEKKLQEQAAARDAAIRTAVKGGVPQSRIVQATKLTKGRVSQIATGTTNTPPTPDKG